MLAVSGHRRRSVVHRLLAQRWWTNIHLEIVNRGPNLFYVVCRCSARMDCWLWTARMDCWLWTARMDCWLWTERMDCWLWTARMDCWLWTARMDCWLWTARMDCWLWTARMNCWLRDMYSPAARSAMNVKVRILQLLVELTGLSAVSCDAEWRQIQPQRQQIGWRGKV